jgi:hypothetical protein
MLLRAVGSDSQAYCPFSLLEKYLKSAEVHNLISPVAGSGPCQSSRFIILLISWWPHHIFSSACSKTTCCFFGYLLATIIFSVLYSLTPHLGTHWHTKASPTLSLLSLSPSPAVAYPGIFLAGVSTRNFFQGVFNKFNWGQRAENRDLGVVAS